MLNRNRLQGPSKRSLSGPPEHSSVASHLMGRTGCAAGTAGAPRVLGCARGACLCREGRNAFTSYTNYFPSPYCNSLAIAPPLSRDTVPQSRHLRARQAVTLALFSLLMFSFLLLRYTSALVFPLSVHIQLHLNHETKHPIHRRNPLNPRRFHRQSRPNCSNPHRL